MAAVLDDPLVSVVTATWGRPRTVLERCLPSVACQDYPRVEHLLVTDGRNDALNVILRTHGYLEGGREKRLVNLGRNWTEPFGNGSNGAIARMVGSYLARGEYIAYLDDDNIWDPSHLSSMVKLAESTGADIISSDFLHHGSYLAGGVVTGQVDSSSFLHRASILRHGSWKPDGYECDGHVVERWIAAGCTWERKPGMTMTITSQRLGAPDD